MSGPISLARLFRECYRDLVGRGATLLGRAEEAEDVAQEAFAGLLGRMSTADIAQPGAYLHAAVRNLALDRLRRSRRESPASDLLASFPSASPSAEDVAVSRQRLALLAAALNELPEPTRAAFLMARLEGLPHREIGARLGVSVSMVEKHVARAVAHARERLSAKESR
jgi:RNA polymerase sigma-70 factor (ECF subfamily)